MSRLRVTGLRARQSAPPPTSFRCSFSAPSPLSSSPRTKERGLSSRSDTFDTARTEAEGVHSSYDTASLPGTWRNGPATSSRHATPRRVQSLMMVDTARNISNSDLGYAADVDSPAGGGFEGQLSRRTPRSDADSMLTDESEENIIERTPRSRGRRRSKFIDTVRSDSRLLRELRSLEVEKRQTTPESSSGTMDRLRDRARAWGEDCRGTLRGLKRKLKRKRLSDETFVRPERSFRMESEQRTPTPSVTSLPEAPITPSSSSNAPNGLKCDADKELPPIPVEDESVPSAPPTPTPPPGGGDSFAAEGEMMDLDEYYPDDYYPEYQLGEGFLARLRAAEAQRDGR